MFSCSIKEMLDDDKIRNKSIFFYIKNATGWIQRRSIYAIKFEYFQIDCPQFKYKTSFFFLNKKKMIYFVYSRNKNKYNIISFHYYLS